MKLFSIALLLFFLINFNSFSQSLIAGIPSADVVENKHLELTHETQWNFWGKPTKWNSFNFLCYGIGNNSELTLSINNLDKEKSKDLAFGVGGKKVFDVFNKKSLSWEQKIVLGANVLYATQKNSFGIWSYGLYSMRIPQLKTRLTGGISYGTSQMYGFRTKFIDNVKVETETPNNIGTVLLGFEQPITNHLSIIADWYSGTHSLAAFISAIQCEIGRNVLIAGYKIANNKESGTNALIVELMINIPTKKEPKVNVD